MSDADIDDELDEEEDEDVARVFSIFSGTRRRNRWRVAADTDVVTVFGRTFLDLRQAEAPRDLVSMRIWCVFGSVTILVPEGCDVRPSGMAFLGSSDSLVPEVPEGADFPPLDVEANVVFGRVRICTALGSSAPAALPVDQPVRRPPQPEVASSLPRAAAASPPAPTARFAAADGSPQPAASKPSTPEPTDTPGPVGHDTDGGSEPETDSGVTDRGDRASADAEEALLA